MTTEREDEVVETFHHWFQQSYPLYERDGRDTTIKRKMELAWNSAQKASDDTIAALKAKCAERERGHADAIEQWKAAEAKCVELEKDARRFEWCLPILTAQGDLGDRRALALAAKFLKGLDGREAIDAALKEQG